MNTSSVPTPSPLTWVSKKVYTLPLRARILYVYLLRLRDNRTLKHTVSFNQVAQHLGWTRRTLIQAFVILEGAGLLKLTDTTWSKDRKKFMTATVTMTKVAGDYCVRVDNDAIWPDRKTVGLTQDQQHTLQFVLAVLNVMNHKGAADLDREISTGEVARKAGMARESLRKFRITALATLPHGYITLHEEGTNCSYKWSLDRDALTNVIEEREVVAEAEAILEAPITPVAHTPASVESVEVSTDPDAETVAKAYRGAMNAMRVRINPSAPLKPVTAKDQNDAVTLLAAENSSINIITAIAVAALGTAWDADRVNVVKGLGYVAGQYDKLTMAPGFNQITETILAALKAGDFLATVYNMTTKDWAWVFCEVLAAKPTIQAHIDAMTTQPRGRSRYPSKVPSRRKYVTQVKRSQS